MRPDIGLLVCALIMGCDGSNEEGPPLGSPIYHDSGTAGDSLPPDAFLEADTHRAPPDMPAVASDAADAHIADAGITDAVDGATTDAPWPKLSSPDDFRPIDPTCPVICGAGAPRSGISGQCLYYVQDPCFDSNPNTCCCRRIQSSQYDMCIPRTHPTVCCPEF